MNAATASDEVTENSTGCSGEANLTNKKTEVDSSVNIKAMHALTSDRIYLDTKLDVK